MIFPETMAHEFLTTQENDLVAKSSRVVRYHGGRRPSRKLKQEKQALVVSWFEKSRIYL